MRLFILLYIMGFTSICLGQKNLVTFLEVKQQGKELHIDYKLQHPPFDHYYLVDLDVTYDGFAITPSRDFIRGDLSTYSQQRIKSRNHQDKKRIIWNVIDEKAVQNVQGDISISLKTRLHGNLPTGPNAVVKSILLPGLGQYKVNEKKGPYFLITAAAYGLVGSGVYYKIKATNTNNQYRVATGDDINILRERWENEERTGNILLIAGGAIWLGDLLFTYLKGKKNQKRFSEYLSSNNSKIQFKLGGSMLVQSPTIGFSYRF